MRKEPRNWILFNSCHLELNHLIWERWWLCKDKMIQKIMHFRTYAQTFASVLTFAYTQQDFTWEEIWRTSIYLLKVHWNDHLVSYFSDVSLWNQYKYIAFNIFKCRTLIISYKMLIITGISNEATNKIIIHTNIMSKRHNILPTRTGFFISSAGKIESVQEFKVKLWVAVLLEMTVM